MPHDSVPFPPHSSLLGTCGRVVVKVGSGEGKRRKRREGVGKGEGGRGGRGGRVVRIKGG